MHSSPGLVFDKVAYQYDALWTNTPVGAAQRETIWRWVDGLFLPGDSILDLGCGTGRDAIHLASLGLNVVGVDASARMVELSRANRVEARQLALEDIDLLDDRYDGAISNFGVLNCVADLRALSAKLGRVIRRRCYFAVCLMGPMCVWEICHYLRHSNPRKAFRRWSRGGSNSSMGVHVNYPSIRQVRSAFRNEFQLVSWVGIGLTVPPSYVTNLSAKSITRLRAIDLHVAHWPVFRVFSDHRLLFFRRL